MNLEKTKVYNLEGAFRGMRNPLASWGRSDSGSTLATTAEEVASTYGEDINSYSKWLGEQTLLCDYYIGAKDMDLAMRLCKAGSEHRKYLRQIIVSVDITAPLYVWKELDTYKVGTVANSTSTMHKLASTPITLDCFEIDDYNGNLKIYDEDIYLKQKVEELIEFYETLRNKYNETKDKSYWKELIRWLPEGWLQTRTMTFNYENIRSICGQRRGHRLSEWQAFVAWAKELPYANQLIFDEPLPAFDKK